MNVIGICAIAVTAALLAVFIKQYREEYGAVIIVIVSVTVLTAIAVNILPLIGEYLGIAQSSGIDTGVFSIILKALGICYLTVFAGDVCRDLGQTALAGRVELAGKLAVAILAMPLVKQIMSAASELMK